MHLGVYLGGGNYKLFTTGKSRVRYSVLTLQRFPHTAYFIIVIVAVHGILSKTSPSYQLSNFEPRKQHLARL